MNRALRRGALPVVLALAAPALQADLVEVVSDRDNTLYEQSVGLTSNGAGDHFFSGKTNIGLLRRAVLHFDVAGAVPAGSTIHSATLRFEMTKTAVGSQQLAVHRLTADWGEESSHSPGDEGGGDLAAAGDATWIHRFSPTELWTSWGGDFEPVASATTSVGGLGSYSWSSAALAADAQDMLDAPASNFGWILKNVNEGPDKTTKRFNTREHPQSSTWPTLILDYTPPAPCTATNYCSSTPNSTGQAALISQTGSCSIADNSFTLVASPVPNTIGIFFYSMGQTNGGAGIPFGNGLRCAGNPQNAVVRRRPTSISGNQQVDAVDFTDLPAHGLISPGQTWNFQAWFRDPPGGGGSFDLSDGLEVTFTP